MRDLLAHLNPPQREAVLLPDEHALILAGAGSGKTRVLTTRIAWLLSQGVPPSAILAVTFTNKAAKEMQTRLAAMVPFNLRAMWIGTFHGLCHRLLRLHHREAGLPAQFQILDAADQLSAIKRLLKNLGIDDERFPPRELAAFINGHKEQGQRAAEVAAHQPRERQRVELYAAYEQQCEREGVVDFAELLLRAWELLSRNEALHQHYRQRFHHILVDEFQDTNALQWRWLQLLARAPQSEANTEGASLLPETTERPVTNERSDHAVILIPGAADLSSPVAAPPQDRTARAEGASVLPETTERPVTNERSDHAVSPPRGGAGGGGCLFCVGDDDQSIYRFRGAEVGNMLDFERRYRVRHIIRLEQNYRSHGNILDAANAIIRHNTSRLGKNLWTSAGAGEPIRVFHAYDGEQEARWMVEEIQALIGEGHARDEIALLYRSNAQSRALEHALFAAGLPYRVHGGLRFFERAEIKHALAYLRLIAHADDDTSFLRVVNFPPRGIGARTLESLLDAARAQNCSLFAATPSLGGRSGAALAAFGRLIDSLRAEAAKPLPELIEAVVEQSGLRAHYQSEKDGEERLANLDELINAAASFSAESQPTEDGDEVPPDGALEAFLTHAALEAGERQFGDEQDAVQLMTIHAAKGLEFNIVFLSGLEEGLLPHENAFDQSENLEEERRLMYVAITRARQRLYLSWASQRMLHGYWRPGLPSRFLTEIPPGLLKWLSDVPRALANHRPTTVQSPSAAARQPDGGLRIGQNVRHARFGCGVIIDARDQQVCVNFAEHGSKWLSLAVAKLEAM